MRSPTLTATDLLKLALRDAPSGLRARVAWFDATKGTDRRLVQAIRMQGEAHVYTVVATSAL
jgi:hypothetical protein